MVFGRQNGCQIEKKAEKSINAEQFLSSALIKGCL